KNDRRSFMKKLTVSSLGVTAMPAVLFADHPETSDPKSDFTKSGRTDSGKKEREYNQADSSEYLKRVAFPIGGMGAGMFCLEGTGAISHMSIRHRPEIYHEPAMFAAIAIKGQKTVAKILEGPVPDWKMFGQRGT